MSKRDFFYFSLWNFSLKFQHEARIDCYTCQTQLARSVPCVLPSSWMTSSPTRQAPAYGLGTWHKRLYVFLYFPYSFTRDSCKEYLYKNQNQTQQNWTVDFSKLDRKESNTNIHMTTATNQHMIKDAYWSGQRTGSFWYYQHFKKEMCRVGYCLGYELWRSSLKLVSATRRVLA